MYDIEIRLAIVMGDFDGGVPPGIGRSVESRINLRHVKRTKRKLRRMKRGRNRVLEGDNRVWEKCLRDRV